MWEVDHTGLPQMLELDDWEVTVLCAWLKTGHWLRPEAREMLDITLASTGCEVTQVNVQLRGGKVQLAVTLCELTSAPSEMILRYSCPAQGTVIQDTGATVSLPGGRRWDAKSSLGDVQCVRGQGALDVDGVEGGGRGRSVPSHDHQLSSCG